MLCKLHVLVVEADDAVMQLILEQLADEFGVSVHLECTGNVSIAYESLTDTQFDAILFDLSLANHGGNTAIAVIRSLAPDTPLFLLLERGYELRQTESPGFNVADCLFKDELSQRAWLRRLYAAMAHRKAFRYLGVIRHYGASTN
jgi:CheY-like chemotaxis protein